MTTLRTAIEDLVTLIYARGHGIEDLRERAAVVRQALGAEPDSDGMVTEQDGFRVEAAGQFGFQDFNDDCTEHRCTTAQLVAFTKGAERAGMWKALQILRDQEKVTGDQHEAVVLGDLANVVQVRMDEIDRELLPIVEAERVRSLTSSGYVRDADGKWIKPEPHEVAARQAGWTLKDDGAFERCASDEPERVHLLGDWKELCEFAGIKMESI